MKRLSIAVAMLAITSVVHADSPHFVRATGTLNNTDGSYTASFKEAGLGGGQTINYELTADAQWVFKCL